MLLYSLEYVNSLLFILAAFDAFDSEKKGAITTETTGGPRTILKCTVSMHVYRCTVQYLCSVPDHDGGRRK